MEIEDKYCFPYFPGEIRQAVLATEPLTQQEAPYLKLNGKRRVSRLNPACPSFKSHKL